MFKSLLSHARVYDAFMGLLGTESARKLYIESHVHPTKGCRLLDIGCGPARILEALPPTEYHGFDPNSDYIASARAKYGERGHFLIQSVSLDLTDLYRDFDLVLAMGVVHHLDDGEAEALFGLAHAALKPGGRLVTLDGCFVPGQSYLARFFLRHDRGQFVRTEEAYLKLARSSFSEIKSTLRTDLLRVPYTHLIMECRRSGQRAS